MRQKIGVVLALVAVTIMGVVWLRQPQVTAPTAQTPLNITIGYRTHDLYAPFFVGVEKQFFAKHNLNVKGVKFESTNQITDALLAHNIDAALGGVNVPLLMLIEDKSPGELKLFTLVKETAAVPVSFLLAPTNSIVATFGDLKGKKIGIFPGSTAKLLYRKMLDRAGLTPSDITVVELKQELQLPALQAGQVDAVIVLQPLATIASAKGMGKIIESGLFSKYFVPEIAVAGSVISSQFVREQPKTANQLVAAIAETIEFINSHQAETAAIAARYTGLDQALVGQTPVSQFYTLSQIQPSDLQVLSDFLFQEHELKNRLDASTLLLKL